VHLVPHLRGCTFHARLKEFSRILSPSIPRLPNENAVHPDPFVIQTPRIAELKGLLVSLCRRHSLSRSEASVVDVHGWCIKLHSDLGLGVNGLAKAHVPNLQENWEE
jgi:hypothetical protein